MIVDTSTMAKSIVSVVGQVASTSRKNRIKSHVRTIPISTWYCLELSVVEQGGDGNVIDLDNIR